MPQGTYFVTTDVSSLGHADGIAFCAAMAERAKVVAIPTQVFYEDGSEHGRHLIRWAFCKQQDLIVEGSGGCGRPTCSLRSHLITRPVACLRRGGVPGRAAAAGLGRCGWCGCWAGPAGDPGGGPDGPDGGPCQVFRVACSNQAREVERNSPTIVSTAASWCRMPAGKASNPTTNATAALVASSQRAQLCRRQVNHASTQAPTAQARNSRTASQSAGTRRSCGRLACSTPGVDDIVDDLVLRRDQGDQHAGVRQGDQPGEDPGERAGDLHRTGTAPGPRRRWRHGGRPVGRPARVRLGDRAGAEPGRGTRLGGRAEVVSGSGRGLPVGWGILGAGRPVRGRHRARSAARQDGCSRSGRGIVVSHGPDSLACPAWGDRQRATGRPANQSRAGPVHSISDRDHPGADDATGQRSGQQGTGSEPRGRSARSGRPGCAGGRRSRGRLPPRRRRPHDQPRPHRGQRRSWRVQALAVGAVSHSAIRVPRVQRVQGGDSVEDREQQEDGPADHEPAAIVSCRGRAVVESLMGSFNQPNPKEPHLTVSWRSGAPSSWSTRTC